MKRLIFLKGWMMYQPGETAGFADDVAAKLLASRVAIDADEVAVADEAAAKAKADADEAAAKAKADADEAAAKAKAKAKVG